MYDSGDKKENCVYIFKLNNMININLNFVLIVKWIVELKGKVIVIGLSWLC